MSADKSNREGFDRIEELIEYFERGKSFTEELMKENERLRLLSDHAATALMSSHLYRRTERKLRTVEGFLDLLKSNGQEQIPR
jgi:hypothetical protein